MAVMADQCLEQRQDTRRVPLTALVAHGILCDEMPPKRRSDLVERVIDGETVILDRAGGNVHRLNATASYVWSQLNGENSAATVAAYVATQFESAPDTVLDDVIKAIDSLDQLGLLERESV
jgi:antitoxin (DNA-binding transcriptional repressor) of toxin-antitoxin stability system